MISRLSDSRAHAHAHRNLICCTSSIYELDQTLSSSAESGERDYIEHLYNRFLVFFEGRENEDLMSNLL